MTYSFRVKIEDVEKRRRSAGLLHIVTGFFLVAKGADYYRYLDYMNLLPVLPFFLLALVSLAYGFARKRIDPEGKNNYWLRLVQVAAFTILGIVFMRLGRSMDYIGVLIFAALCIILLFLERKVFHETNIILSDEGLIIPGSYRDHLVKWQDLSQVVIREDFVTIFHVKKKYLQYQVMQDLSTLETTKMNAFCREKIENIASEADQHQH